MAITKYDLADWVFDALMANGRKSTIVNVCKYIWKHHELDLRNAGDLFYTWQYDVRWAATELRNTGKMKSVETSDRGIWELR